MALSLDCMHRSAYHVAVDYARDEAKASLNAKKHRVRFADAVGVFEDEAALSREDLGSEGASIRRYRHGLPRAGLDIGIHLLA